MSARRFVRKGFTLVEILIVVIILGILAAIVIPQFTNATTDARTNSAQALQNTIRNALQLYRLQHNDQLPPAFSGAAAGSTLTTAGWDQMLAMSTANHATTTVSGPGVFGPYLQSIPTNPLNNSSTIWVTNSDTAAPSALHGFILNNVSGRFWVTNTPGTARLTN